MTIKKLIKKIAKKTKVKKLTQAHLGYHTKSVT